MMNAHRLAVRIHDVESTNANETLGDFSEDIRDDILQCIIPSAAVAATAVEAYVNDGLFEIRER